VEYFYRLTPDWVLRAVEAGGYRPTGHCFSLNCLENRVYDLRLEDGSHVVAKFYRPGRWSAEAIREEHRFLAELREAEIPVCAPLSFPDGSTLGKVEGIYYALWLRVGGRSPDELSDAEVQLLGRMLARIHNVGASAEAKHRPVLDAETLGREPLAFLDRENFLPGFAADRYERAVNEVVEIYEKCSAGVPVHRIHGDCHHGNLLHDERNWFFLDFDDFRTGPAVHDVWMLLPGRDPESAHQRRLFVEAYSQFRRFDPRWLRLVEPLRALRFISYTAWIAKRWNDPAFPLAFPFFGSESYWEAETRDLEMQLERIRESEDEYATFDL